MNKIKVLMYWN